MLQKYFNKLGPIKDIVYFVFLFLFFEFVWKLLVHQGADDSQLIILKYDCTDKIYPICKFTADVTYGVIHTLLGYTSYHIDGLFIYFENALKMKIVWGCTGIKQMILLTFILICSFGPWKKKVYYIPISLIILFLINILRLVITSFLIKNGFPDWFIPVNESMTGLSWDNSKEMYWQFYIDWYHFFHDGFFKWIYYDGVMFFLWLYWQEKINIPYQKDKIEMV